MNIQQVNSYINEVWQVVPLGEGFINTRQLQVSNFGRVRSCTPGKQDYRLLRGSKQEGYAIIRLRLLKPRKSETQQLLNSFTQQKMNLAKSVATYKTTLQTTATATERAKLKAVIIEEEKKLETLKRNYTKTYKKTEKERTVHQAFLVHRLVATYFCAKPLPGQTLVIHKDYNKLNNYYSNLQWATMDESIAHQQHSPYVIEERKLRSGSNRPSKATKLTVTRVMLIKKRLLENTPMRRLAKQFKVTETQIARIKKGENWKDIPAAI